MATLVETEPGLYEVRTLLNTFIMTAEDPNPVIQEMIQIFQSDPLELESFAALLDNNPLTAYDIYNNISN